MSYIAILMSFQTNSLLLTMRKQTSANIKTYQTSIYGDLQGYKTEFQKSQGSKLKDVMISF